MADDLIFYTHPMSRGRVIRWMLEELGVPYETVLLDYGSTMKAADYLAVNPMGKVPAISHGGKVVTEVGAICAYLADAFPDAGLGPTPEGRADYYRWMFFAAGPIEAAITDKALGVQVPEDKRGFVGYGSMDAALDAIEGAVAGKRFIAGDRFSAADVHVGSLIGFFMGFGSIPKRPAFVEYVDALKARPAAVRAAEIDDKLLAEQKAKAENAHH